MVSGKQNYHIAFIRVDDEQNREEYGKVVLWSLTHFLDPL